MTAGYQCPWGEPPHAGEIIVTWLDNGATLTPCREHFSPLMLHVLATDLGVDPDKFYGHVKRFVDRAAKQDQASGGKDTTAAGKDQSPDGRGGSTLAAAGNEHLDGQDLGAAAASSSGGDR